MRSLYERNLLSTLHLLLAMVAHFTSEGRLILDLPPVVTVGVVRMARGKDGGVQVSSGHEDLCRYAVICKLIVHLKCSRTK